MYQLEMIRKEPVLA